MSILGWPPKYPAAWLSHILVAGLTNAEEELREAGITLWLAALNPEPLRVIERSPLGAILGHERMFFNLEQAVEAYVQQNPTN